MAQIVNVKSISHVKTVDVLFLRCYVVYCTRLFMIYNISTRYLCDIGRYIVTACFYRWPVYIYSAHIPSRVIICYVY